MTQTFLGIWSRGTGNGTLFANPFVAYRTGGTTNDATVTLPVAGTLKNLRVTSNLTYTGSMQDVVSLYHNGAVSALAVTLNTANGNDITDTDTVAVTAGDTLTLRCVVTGSPTARLLQMSFEFEATAADTSVYGCGAVEDVLGTAPTNCGLIGGGEWATDANAASNSDIVAVDGTFTEMRLRLSTAPTSGKSRTFTIYKNGVAQDGSGGTPNTALTISDAATTGSASFSLSVVAGDLVRVRHTTTGTPTNTHRAAGTVVFVSAVADAWMMATIADVGPSGTSTVYNPANGSRSGSGTWTTTEATHQERNGPTTFWLSRLRVAVTTAPGSGKSWTFTLRKNGADAIQSVAIADAATGGDSASAGVQVTAGDLLALTAVPAGTPTSAASARYCFMATPTDPGPLGAGISGVLTQTLGALTLIATASTVFHGLTIGGVPYDLLSGSLRIQETLNGRNTFTADVLSRDGSDRPAMGAEVVYTVDGIRLFGGLLDAPGERGFSPYGGEAVVYRIEALDFNALPDRRLIWEGDSAPIPVGTLKDALLVLVPYLAIYGVTLDPAQADGPTLPLLDYWPRRMREVLDELSTLTGFGWEINYTKVLRMVLPGTEAAPFDVVPATDPSVVIGDLTVEQDDKDYANRATVLIGSGQAETTATFVGDGTTRIFPLPVPMAGVPPGGGQGVAGVVAVNGTPVTVGIVSDTTLEWIYDSAQNLLIQLADAPPGTPHAALTGSDTLTAVYIGNYPVRLDADDAAAQAAVGLWEKLYPEPKVFEVARGQALADAYLARALVIPKTIRYTTFELGPRPGQVQTVTVPDRNLTGTFLITDVEVTDSVAHTFVRRVTAQSGTLIQPSWRALYKHWSGAA